MTSTPGDNPPRAPGQLPMWIEGDMLVMQIDGPVEVREMRMVIELSEGLYNRNGYTLVLGDARLTKGLTPDARKLHAERIKDVLRPSHTAIHNVSSVGRMMTTLAQRGIELVSGKTYPVSFHKDEAEARAELARQRAILRASAGRRG